MTEEHWLACADPTPMLDFLRGRLAGRTLRRFVTAACRRNASNLAKDLFRDALAVAERYADGSAGDDELAWASARTALASFRRVNMAHGHAHHLVHWATQPDASMPTAAGLVLSKKPAAQAWQAAALRDVVGNPLRPLPADPAWRTSTALGLAEAIRAGERFDRLPILADALEDAGCDDDLVLGHCRGGGVHVRGCWVVDFLLGKA